MKKLLKYSPLGSIKLFTNERLVSDKPFVEKPVLENPKWMAQPAAGSALPRHLRPIKFSGEEPIGFWIAMTVGVIATLCAGAFFFG